MVSKMAELAIFDKSFEVADERNLTVWLFVRSLNLNCKNFY